VLSSRTKKTHNRSGLAFRLAAQSLSRSHSALGGFYRRMQAQHGPAKANAATAHKLAPIVYHIPKNRTTHADPREHYYQQQDQQRAIRNLRRKAAQLNLELVPISAQPPAVS
jgi:hypothetical protein